MPEQALDRQEALGRNLLRVAVAVVEAGHMLAQAERLRWEKQRCSCMDHNRHPARPASAVEGAVELLVAHLQTVECPVDCPAGAESAEEEGPSEQHWMVWGVVATAGRPWAMSLRHCLRRSILARVPLGHLCEAPRKQCLYHNPLRTL